MVHQSCETLLRSKIPLHAEDKGTAQVGKAFVILTACSEVQVEVNTIANQEPSHGANLQCKDRSQDTELLHRHSHRIPGPTVFAGINLVEPELEVPSTWLSSFWVSWDSLAFLIL